jgi:hypothetical protein
LIKPTSDQDLPVGLHSHSSYRRVGIRNSRIEAGVQAAVGIEPRNFASVRAVDGVEKPAHQHFSVSLQRDCLNVGVGWSEAVIESSIGIEANNPVSVGAIKSETAAGQHLSIRLQRDGRNVANGILCKRIKTRIETPVGIETR